MALVVEDGSNVAGATSFVTRAEFIAYAAARGVTVADADATDVFAFNAMDYLRMIEGKGRLKGTRAYVDQNLPFPRVGIVYGDDVEPYSIPQGIKDAQLQLMLEAKNGIALTPSQSNEQQVSREKVGPLETEYFSAAAYSATLPLVDALLGPFLNQLGFGFATVRV